MQVDLTVSINTVSGKIVAGIVGFNALDNNTATLPLKRCSDKTATITLSVSFEKVRKVRDVEGEVDVDKIVPAVLDRSPRVQRDRIFQSKKKETSQSASKNSSS